MRVQAAQKRLFKKLKIKKVSEKAGVEESKYELQSLLAESDSDEDGKDKDESSDELLDEELGEPSALENLDNMD